MFDFFFFLNPQKQVHPRPRFNALTVFMFTSFTISGRTIPCWLEIEANDDKASKVATHRIALDQISPLSENLAKTFLMASFLHNSC